MEILYLGILSPHKDKLYSHLLNAGPERRKSAITKTDMGDIVFLIQTQEKFHILVLTYCSLLCPECYTMPTPHYVYGFSLFNFNPI